MNQTEITAVPLTAGTAGAEVAIPQLGFGVFQVPEEDTERVVLDALEIGYRHIDGAAVYGNEKGVGAAIAASGIPREDMFLTSKVWNESQGHRSTRAALERTLSDLGIDRLDLYLIHWPCPARGRALATWMTLIELQREGLVRAIGVSNFRESDLAMLVEETGIAPAVNQIELHPGLQRRDLVAACGRIGTVVEAWAPLGQRTELSDPVITAIAAERGITPAQAVIAWHLVHGGVLFPKSVSADRLRENFAAHAGMITADDVARIDALDAGAWVGPFPESLN